MRKEVVGFEGLYEVDTGGHVYSILQTNSRRTKELSQYTNEGGYLKEIKTLRVTKTGSSISANEVIKSIYSIIDNQPTVDARMVVFCKDCEAHGKCIFEETFTMVGMQDGYCRVGKRMYGGENE